MAQSPLPITRGRLPGSCEIWASSSGNVDPTAGVLSLLNPLASSTGLNLTGNAAFSASNLWSSVLGLASNLGTVKKVGATNKITVTQERDVEAIHSLGRYSFEPQFMVPKAVSYTIEMQRTELYAQPALQVFGFASGTIYSQQVPIMLKEVKRTSPTSDDSLEVLYIGCWLRSNKYTIELEEGNVVANSLTFKCAAAFSTDSTLFALKANSKKFVLNNPIKL